MTSQYVTATCAINALITTECRGQLIVGRLMRAKGGCICR